MKLKSIIIALIVVSCALLVTLGWEPIAAATRKIRPTAFTGKNTIKQVSKTSLVGSWDFNECETCTTVADISGNARNGTTYNTYGATALNLRSSNGIRGRSVLLDGVNDYASFADQADWDFAGDFTISLWANFTAVNTSDDWWQTAFIAHDDGGGAAQKKWIFTYDGDSTSRTKFHIQVPSNCAPELTGNAWTPATGVWYQIGITRTGTNYTFYRDGKSDGTATDTCVIPNASATLTLGWAEGNTKVFNGRIDEVKIYSRALSSSEMERLYNENRLPNRANVGQNSFLPDGLVGLWSFNGKDLISGTAFDRSPSGVDGTLSNSPTPNPGVVGQGLFCDGVNDYVTVSSYTAIETETFTTTFWVKGLGTGQLAGFTRVLSKTGNSTVSPGWEIMVNGTANTVRVRADTSDGISQDKFGTVVLFDDQWHFVALTADSGTFELYKDGASQGTATYSLGTGLANAAVSFRMCVRSTNVNDARFKGTIDEVRMYDRVITATEVSQFYNSSKH